MLAADAFHITYEHGVVVREKPPQVALAAGGVLDVECPPNVKEIFTLGDEVVAEFVGRKHYITFRNPDSVNRRLREERAT